MPIDYQPARPDDRDILAAVFQRGYGLANGPKGNIKYLGTYGVESCLAVGIVLHKAEEDYPRIALGHFDIGTLVMPSVFAMLNGIRYESFKEGALYFASSEPQGELTRAVRDLLPATRFDLSTDYSRNGHQLIFDLATGMPVEPGACDRLHGYGVYDDVVEERVMKDDIRKKYPLALEIDMRDNIPTAGLALQPNKRNPVRDIRLES